MRWSWKLAQVAGIQIYVHATFLILLAWVALSYYAAEPTAASVLGGLAFTLSLFAIVVLHELGHALTAKRFGIRTRDITLLPIGGVARLERMPEDPWQEFLVAIAGPAVNVGLAVLFFAILVGIGATVGLQGLTLTGGMFLAKLMWANVALAVFNMIPAFPMDGGRVLRALLATRLDYVRATHVAASVGQAFALLFGFLGLFANPVLVFIALFVWLGAAEEAAMVQMRAAMSGIPVSHAMVRDFETLAPDDTLGHAVAHVLAGFQHDFPVRGGPGLSSVAGVLTREDLLRGIARLGTEAPVSEVMQTTFETAAPGEMLEQALARLRSSGCPSLPVLKDGRIVGILTLDNVGELVMVQTALREHDAPGRRIAPSPLVQPAV